MQLGELQDHLADFHKLGADVWAIDSTDRLDKLAGFAQFRSIGFPMLADPGLAVTKEYGVLNQATRNLAYPTTMVIDRKGVVRYVRTEVDFTKRPPVYDLLAVLKGLGK